MYDLNLFHSYVDCTKMATSWSSFYNSIEIRDFDALKMTVDYTGSVVMLASYNQYGIMDISNPTCVQSTRSLKYEINALEWNRTSHNQHMCALAYHTQLRLTYWKNNADLVSLATLNGHTRTILDINWHPNDPNLLASTSGDSFIHIWDVRTTSRPVIPLSAIVPAAKVQWNQLAKNLIATAHGGDVQIWDDRYLVHPIRYFTAHTNSIYCLDWSYTNKNKLITSSHDCTVKFFETSNLKKPENVLNTSTHVQIAKYTPFGDGILIVLVPHQQKVDHNLLLWNLNAIKTPVHTFVGHSDTILEFQWFKNHEDENSEYKFITWSKDQTMRFWHVVPYLQETPIELDQKVCTENSEIFYNTQNSEASNKSSDTVYGYNTNLENEEEDDNFSVSSSNSAECVELPPLIQEYISLVNDSEIFIEQKDPDRRTLIAIVSVNDYSLTISMQFPPEYPDNKEPLIKISKSNYDASMKNTFLEILYDAAIKQVSKNLPCVQYCLYELATHLRTIPKSTDSQFVKNEKQTYKVIYLSPSPYEQTGTCISNSDSFAIHQHKTIGLKFCNNGALLWFTNPKRKLIDILSGIADNKDDFITDTPPSSFTLNWLGSDDNISPTDSGDQSSKNNKEKNSDKPSVAIYDVSCLFPINKDLASKYELDVSNVFRTCMRNAWITNSIKRKDLFQTWSLAAYACSTNGCMKNKFSLSIDQINSWKNHPFTSLMIDSLVTHYASHSDFQTAALLCCVFNPNPVIKNIEHDRNPTPVYTRSNSFSSGFSFSRAQEESNECFEICDQGLVVDDSSSKKDFVYDEYKKIYMAVLDNFGLLDQEASVNQFLKKQTQESCAFLLNFVVKCNKCDNFVKNGYCLQCQHFNVICSLCNSTVRGAAHVCLKCGHGGHADHLYHWFSVESLCAVNCGCRCLFETMCILHINWDDD